ncbi:hypothetical protein MUP35_00705 [Patescibacteria group bacterium]|nr:hypothetical protein [Patescibacteria group bacterium]
MKKNTYSLEELILLGIQNTIEKKKKCSYGDLINELFSKYPGIFSIADYLKWPDTLKLDRPLRSLRSDRLITGSPITFYSLTPLGQEKTRQLKKRNDFSVEYSLNKPTRSPSLTLLKELEDSEDFKNYVSDRGNFKPNKMKIRALTRFTLETPKKVVLGHLSFLKKVSHKEKKKDLEEFLTTYINYIKGTN